MAKIYNYDANGYYTGVSYEFNGKILPKFTTRVAPPETKHNEKAKYIVSGNKWTIEIQELNININRNENTNPSPTITTSVFDMNEGEYIAPINIEANREECKKYRQDMLEQIEILKTEIANLKKSIDTISKRSLFKY